MLKGNDGLVVTGFDHFDEVSRQYLVADARPMLDMVYEASPVSRQFEWRHREWGLHQWYEFRTLAKDADVMAVVMAYNELPEVDMAEPVYRIRRIEPTDTEADASQEENPSNQHLAIEKSSWTPNDPFYANNQWHLNNTGQVINGVAGTPGADLGMPAAWDIEKGNSSVVVAVLDGGVQFNHPDLAANMWPGVGYNFVDDNSAIVPDNHGTHVAGTIAAVTNNATGVAGIAGGSGTGNGVRIMSLQVINGSESGGVMQAFVYAADHGAAITQNSWGYEEADVFNQADLDAIDYFNANGGGGVMNGGVSIFAAGNTNSQAAWYPAFYSGTIAVAATDHKDTKTSFSNYGTWIDISAPGFSVYSTRNGSSYGNMSGTSAACPNVSGVAALIVSHMPGQLSAGELTSMIINSATPIDGINPAFAGLLGSGRVSAINALLPYTGGPQPVQAPSWILAEQSGSQQATISWQKNANADPVMMAWSSDGNFGTPTDGIKYNTGQSLPGGGVILYQGAANNFIHGNLDINNRYYYRIWSSDTDNNYSPPIHATVDIVPYYSIIATADHGGSISPSGNLFLPAGRSQSFSITALPDYQISDVIVDGISVGAVSTYVFSIIRDNHTIHAEFVADNHTILASSGPGGSITPSGEVVVNHGANQSFQMSPQTSYQIREVLVDGTDVGTPGSYTFVNVTSDHTIEVSFELVKHTVTASAGQGGAIDPEGINEVDHGDNITFAISPNEGYQIEDVLVNGWPIGPVDTYTFSNVRSNRTIHAEFTRKKYMIYASANRGGSISPGGEIEVSHGDDQGFVFMPDTGYHIERVVIDSLSMGAISEYTFERVVSDHRVEAVFHINTYTVTSTSSGGGIVSPAGSTIVEHGENFSYQLIPDEGHHIIDVLIDGESIGAVVSYTFAEIAASHDIHAVFGINTYTLTASSSGGGTVSPTGTVVAKYGESRTVQLIPDIGHHITDVLIDGESIGAVVSYTFTRIAASHDIHAVFGINTYTLTASSSEGGTVSPTGIIVVTYGSSRHYQVLPDEGYHIADVEVDGVSIGAAENYTFTDLTADHHIHAEFAINTYTITATSTEGGEIIPEGEVLVAHGSSQLFSVFQQESFHLADVLVDGVSVGVMYEYLFEEVTQHHAIHAIFEADPEPLNEVVFMVDMQFAEGFVPSADELYLTGSFFGWEGRGLHLNAKSGLPEKSPMVFYGYLELPAGSYTYTYYLNTFPGGAEWQGPVYRTLTVPDTLRTYDIFGYRTDPTHVPVSNIENMIGVFPNPAKDRVFVESREMIASVRLFDLYGKVLQQSLPGAQFYSLDLGGVPPGVYVLRVETHDRRFRTFRLVVQ